MNEPARLSDEAKRLFVSEPANELVMTSSHAVAAATLPPLHKDPFDRLLLAQATVEGLTLLTVDEVLARDPGPMRKV